MRSPGVKWLCENCGWCGTTDKLLRAAHPFQRIGSIYGCPSCREVGDLLPACDEPGCCNPSTCGTPTPQGYRRTCGQHAPQRGGGRIHNTGPTLPAVHDTGPTLHRVEPEASAVPRGLTADEVRSDALSALVGWWHHWHPGRPLPRALEAPGVRPLEQTIEMVLMAVHEYSCEEVTP